MYKGLLFQNHYNQLFNQNPTRFSSFQLPEGNILDTTIFIIICVVYQNRGFILMNSILFNFSAIKFYNF